MIPALLVLGTRPEAVKLYPLYRALRDAGYPCEVVSTNQSPDLFGWDGPVRSLDLPNDGDPHAFVARTHVALRQHFPFKRLVVVQGDTSSACGGAEYAHRMGFPLAHVEAGLRTHYPDDPYPEELFRVRIDQLATYRYPPTDHAARNLEAEGLSYECVTGNTGIDAIRDLPLASERTNEVWVTLHRRENKGERIDHIMRAIYIAASFRPDLTWNVVRHPNNAVPLGAPTPNHKYHGPVHPDEFRPIVARATAVISDSGGLVEECAWMGTPICITRMTTERPEAIEAGIAVLAAPIDEQSVLEGIHQTLRLESGKRSTVFGTGSASQLILSSFLTLARNRITTDF